MTVIVDHRGRPLISSARQAEKLVRYRDLRARYDAAITNADNENHWRMADSLDAVSANSPEVRRILRSRSRYEFANNSFLKGMVMTLANITIGRSPRIKIETKDEGLNYFIEAEFKAWAKAVQLPRRARTMRAALTNDGETFIHKITNNRLNTPVKLSFKISEAEHFTHPHSRSVTDREVDGIRFDEDGNPETYYRLKHHPGGTSIGMEAEELSADDVIHWYREERPGQRRGIPHVTPALPLFAMVRRWELATLAAAETAADFAAVMYTDNPSIDPEDIPNIGIDEAIDITRRMYQVLPNGWKMSQLKAEHPGTTFKEFQACMWGEAARCILLPYNVAAGNSSGYNFASGRLDTHAFQMAIDIDREDCESVVLTPLFMWWLDEALMIPGYLPESKYLRQIATQHSWGWDSAMPVIDQTKQANANLIELMCGTASREDILARQHNQSIDEFDARTAPDFGMTVEEYRKAIGQAIFKIALPAKPADENENSDEEEEANAD